MMWAHKKNILSLCIEELIANEDLRQKVCHHAYSDLVDMVDHALPALRDPKRSVTTLYHLKDEVFAFPPHSLPVADENMKTRWCVLMDRLDNFYSIYRNCKELGQDKDVPQATLDHLTEGFSGYVLSLAENEKCINVIQDQEQKKTFKKFEKYKSVVESLIEIMEAYQGRYISQEVNCIYAKHKGDEVSFIRETKKYIRAKIQKAIQVTTGEEYRASLKVVNGVDQERSDNLLGTICRKIEQQCEFAFPILEQLFANKAQAALETEFALFVEEVNLLREEKGVKAFRTSKFKELLKENSLDRFAESLISKPLLPSKSADVLQIKDFAANKKVQENVRQRLQAKQKRGLKDITATRHKREVDRAFLGKTMRMEVVESKDHQPER